MIKKRNMTNAEWADKFLKKQGLRELTAEERNSPEFKKSLDNTRLYLNELETKYFKSKKNK